MFSYIMVNNFFLPDTWIKGRFFWKSYWAYWESLLSECTVHIRTIISILDSVGSSGIFIMYASIFFLTIPNFFYIIEIVVVFKCCNLAVLNSRSLYFEILSNTFVGMFLSDRMAMSLREHLHFLKSYYYVGVIHWCSQWNSVLEA